MTKQNIFIINFNLLYEILNEIKENLSFKVIQYKDEDDFVRDKNKDIKNSLIVSNHKQIFSLKYENLFQLNKLPTPLNKLIESINIQLISSIINLK